MMSAPDRDALRCRPSAGAPFVGALLAMPVEHFPESAR